MLSCRSSRVQECPCLDCFVFFVLIVLSVLNGEKKCIIIELCEIEIYESIIISLGFQES